MRYACCPRYERPSYRRPPAHRPGTSPPPHTQAPGFTRGLTVSPPHELQRHSRVPCAA